MATATTRMVEVQETEGVTTKRPGLTTKRPGLTTKRIELTQETTEAYSRAGADGDYKVTIPDGEPITIRAITIRVLDHGELNLLTDTGRWYLFAPNAWKTASPVEPKPSDYYSAVQRP